MQSGEERGMAIWEEELKVRGKRGKGGRKERWEGGKE